jgi:hypothetical protein
MRYFCTYLDSNYLVRGLTLYWSLRRHSEPFQLWILCFDVQAFKILEDLCLDGIIPISLNNFERGDDELLQAKSNRTRIEYYFTCTPSLPLYIWRKVPAAEVISYIDSDLFFFSNPSPIYRELGNNSILIVEHRFPPHLEKLEIFGIYNVGIISFRRNKEGLECLRWWRSRCLEWCYDRVEEGRFADQKYLDDWPTRFKKVKVLNHKGAGLAPWNVENDLLSFENGKLSVDSQPLIFYHFHGLKQVGRWLYDPRLQKYGLAAGKILKWKIYGSYFKELNRTVDWLKSVGVTITSMESIRGRSAEPVVKYGLFDTILEFLEVKFKLISKLYRGKLWLVIAGKMFR